MASPDRGPHRRKHVRKISISLSDDVLEWVYHNKDELKVSTFINKVLRDRMRSELSPEGYGAEVFRLERRIQALEDTFEQCMAAKPGGHSFSTGRIARAAVPPHDVFEELVSIKNVSADNARTVRDELIPFLIEKGVVDRSVVISELFPQTRSTITNEINYWYNACRGVLDHLATQGYVVKEHRNKYRWTGKTVT